MFDLAIIGFGPRGLYALESFFLSLSEQLAGMDSTLSRKRKRANFKILIFESNKFLGAGTAWSPEQSEGNWNNISDRNLDNLSGRDGAVLGDLVIPEFPDFTTWSKKTFDHEISEERDHFFLRKQMGIYLNERANSMVDAFSDREQLKVIQHKAISLSKKSDGFDLATKNKVYQVKNVLLSTGHLPTRPSDENVHLMKHAYATGNFFVSNPYSSGSDKLISKADSLIIKGMGLSMIDVVRQALDAKRGDFIAREESIYLKYSKVTSKKIYPYSLDGLPPIPKPVGQKIDQLFQPDDSKVDIFKSSVESSIKEGSDVIATVLKEMSILAAETFLATVKHDEYQDLSFEELRELIEKWYRDPTVKDELIIDSDLEIADYMKVFCEMAYGERQFSLDYVAGHTWRKLHPTLYDLFAHSEASDSDMSELVKLDEQLKQFTYGPPVESILQLIALAENGCLNFDLVKDPELNLVDEGYQLQKSGKSVTADTLVDSVLADPVWLEIDDPLIKSIQAQNLAEVVGPELGIRTNENSMLVVNGSAVTGLYTLGRLTKGSVLGTDAILESFGDTVRAWGDALARCYLNAK